MSRVSYGDCILPKLTFPGTKGKLRRKNSFIEDNLKEEDYECI